MSDESLTRRPTLGLIAGFVNAILSGCRKKDGTNLARRQNLHDPVLCGSTRRISNHGIFSMDRAGKIARLTVPRSRLTGKT